MSTPSTSGAIVNDNTQMKEHHLMQPETSTIMMRRNSAMEKNVKPNNKSSNAISSAPSSPLSESPGQNLIQLSPDSNILSYNNLR